MNFKLSLISTLTHNNGAKFAAPGGSLPCKRPHPSGGLNNIYTSFENTVNEKDDIGFFMGCQIHAVFFYFVENNKTFHTVFHYSKKQSNDISAQKQDSKLIGLKRNKNLSSSFYSFFMCVCVCVCALNK